MPSDTSPNQHPNEPTIRPPVAMSLLVPGAALVFAGLAFVVAWAGEGRFDVRAVTLGAVAAFAPSVFPPAVFAVAGPQPAGRFGVLALALAGLRFVMVLGAALLVLTALHPQPSGFALGFLPVAGASLAAEKIVAVLALRPSWASPSHGRATEPTPAGSHA